MNITRNLTLVCSLVAALSMAGCAGMSRSERATAAGATVGGVAGAILTDGSPAGVAAGAVVGGVVGNRVEKRRD